MAFNVGDGVFEGGGPYGFITCHGMRGESCDVFPCPPYDGVYAGWWTNKLVKTPDHTFRLFWYTGTHWELLSEHYPGVHTGYVFVRWGFTEGNCGFTYMVQFGESSEYFLVGEVPVKLIPCNMWTKDMIKIEKDRLKELIKAEKADASADVKEIRAEAKTEVAMIRGKAKTDIAAERAEYKLSSTDIRGRVKRELVDIRDLHNALEARLKIEYKTAKTLSDDEEREEKGAVRDVGKTDIAEEKQKERDDVGNVRKQKDLDVAAEYRGRDEDIRGRYDARDRTVQEIKDSGKPCVVF